MTTFKSTILLLLISASVISGTTKTRTARGIFGSIFSGLGGGKGSGGALIVLHGLGGGTGGPICKLMDVGLPLDSSVKIVCPQAEWTSNTLLPPTWLYALVGIGPRIKSWYSMNMMPGMSTLSPIPGESKAGLEDAMKRVEGVIQKLVNQGIPSEKIVLSGLSQGGSLTLYTALHTKYKLGGFIGIVDEAVRVATSLSSGRSCGDSSLLASTRYKEVQLHGEVKLAAHVSRLVAHPRHRLDGPWGKARLQQLCAIHGWVLSWHDQEQANLEREALAVGLQNAPVKSRTSRRWATR